MDDDRFEMGDLTGELQRAAEGNLGPVLTGDFGNPFIVRGYDDPIDISASACLMKRVRHQGQGPELLDVQIGDFIVSPTSGYDGHDTKRTYHRLRTCPR